MLLPLSAYRTPWKTALALLGLLGLLLFPLRTALSTTHLLILGLFLLALAGNCTLVIQIPYNWPLVAIALHDHTLAQLVGLGAVIGIGAGIGEVIAYTLMFRLGQRLPRLKETPLLQKIILGLRRYPALAPGLIFASALLPTPDDLVIFPLAFIKYPVQHFALPMFAGKLLHNVAVGLLLHYAVHLYPVPQGIQLNGLLLLPLLFVGVLLYQLRSVTVCSEHKNPI